VTAFGAQFRRMRPIERSALYEAVDGHMPHRLSVH
jgi:hypothetical protein